MQFGSDQDHHFTQEDNTVSLCVGRHGLTSTVMLESKEIEYEELSDASQENESAEFDVHVSMYVIDFASGALPLL
jgi:hypothetical protein